MPFTATSKKGVAINQGKRGEEGRGISQPTWRAPNKGFFKFILLYLLFQIYFIIFTFSNLLRVNFPPAPLYPLKIYDFTVKVYRFS